MSVVAAVPQATLASLAVIGAFMWLGSPALCHPLHASKPQSHVAPSRDYRSLCRIGAYDEAVKSDKPTKPTKPDLRHMRDLRSWSV